jgi:hypothetical protein
MCCLSGVFTGDLPLSTTAYNILFNILLNYILFNGILPAETPSLLPQQPMKYTILPLSGFVTDKAAIK